MRHAGPRQCLFGPGRFQRQVVEELGGGDKAIDGIGGIAPLVEQVKLIFADLLQAELRGAGLVKSRQALHVVDEFLWVCGERLRNCMSSNMRRRSGVMRWLLEYWIGHWGK